MKNFLFVDSAVYADDLGRELALKLYGLLCRKLPDGERENFRRSIRPSRAGTAKSEIFGLYLDPAAIIEAAASYGVPLGRRDINYTMHNITEEHKANGMGIKAVRRFMKGYDGTRIMIGTYPEELMERMLPLDMGYFDHFLLNHLVYDGDYATGISRDITHETQPKAMAKFLDKKGVEPADGNYPGVAYIGSDPFCSRIAEHYLDPANDNNEALKNFRFPGSRQRLRIFQYPLSRV